MLKHDLPVPCWPTLMLLQAQSGPSMVTSSTHLSCHHKRDVFLCHHKAPFFDEKRRLSQHNGEEHSLCFPQFIPHLLAFIQFIIFRVPKFQINSETALDQCKLFAAFLLNDCRKE